MINTRDECMLGLVNSIGSQMVESLKSEEGEGGRGLFSWWQKIINITMVI